jgi:hypothetical protein
MQDSFKLDGIQEQDIEPRRSPLPLRHSNILDLPLRSGVQFLESDCVQHWALVPFKKVRCTDATAPFFTAVTQAGHCRRSSWSLESAWYDIEP